MVKQLLIYSIFFLFFAACAKHTEIDYESTKVINLTGNSEDMVLSEIVTDVRYIPLQTTDEALIGEINKLFFRKNRFYIGDNTISKGVFIFDDFGKFIFKIGEMGNGPDEFLNIGDFAVDDESGKVYIHDVSRFEVKIFSPDGNYESSFHVPFRAENMEFFNDKFYFYCNYVNSKEVHNLIITDKKGKILEKFLPFEDKSGTHLIISNSLHKFKNHINLLPSVGTDIYTITNEKINKSYSLKFKGIPLELAQLPSNTYELEMALMERSRVLDYYNESDELIYFMYFDQKETLNCFYDKKSKRLKFGRLNNDLELLPFTPLCFIGNKSIVGYINAADVINTQEYLHNYSKQFSKQQLEYFESNFGQVNSSQNPILAVYNIQHL